MDTNEKVGLWLERGEVSTVHVLNNQYGIFRANLGRNLVGIAELDWLPLLKMRVFKVSGCEL